MPNRVATILSGGAAGGIAAKIGASALFAEVDQSTVIITTALLTAVGIGLGAIVGNVGKQIIALRKEWRDVTSSDSAAKLADCVKVHGETRDILTQLRESFNSIVALSNARQDEIVNLRSELKALKTELTLAQSRIQELASKALENNKSLATVLASGVQISNPPERPIPVDPVAREGNA